MATSSPVPAPHDTSTPADAAVIVNSGSTNTSPYTIVVRPNGNAHIEVASQPAETKKLSEGTAKAFFAAVRAAMPLDAIKTVPCVKSASFGTRMFVRYRGVQSPDLSCASGDAAQRLASDIQKVTADLGVTALRHFDGMRMPLTAPSPSPTSSK